MQIVLRRHSWMTQADVRIFLLAWRLGLEWSVGNLGSELALMVPSNNTSFWWVNEEAAGRERSLRKFLVKPHNSVDFRASELSRILESLRSALNVYRIGSFLKASGNFV